MSESAVTVGLICLIVAIRICSRDWARLPIVSRLQTARNQQTTPLFCKSLGPVQHPWQKSMRWRAFSAPLPPTRADHIPSPVSKPRPQREHCVAQGPQETGAEEFIAVPLGKTESTLLSGSDRLLPGHQMNKARREKPDGPFGPVFRVGQALADRQKPLGLTKEVRFHFIAPA